LRSWLPVDRIAGLLASLNLLVLLYERVLEDDLSVWPSLRTLLQDEIDETADLRRSHRHLYLVSQYLPQLLLGDYLKRVFAGKELVSQRAQCPQVNLAVVLLPLEHFGSQVERSAAESAPESFGLVDCPPEVADLGHSVRENDVFQLDVAVDDSVRVHVGDPLRHLPDYQRSSLLRDGAALLQHAVEVPLAAQLHEEVEVGAVREAVVKPHQVGMTEECLDLYLVSYLPSDLIPLLHRAIRNSSLLQHLHCSHKASLSVPK
jgi:hypothetical protein